MAETPLKEDTDKVVAVKDTGEDATNPQVPRQPDQPPAQVYYPPPPAQGGGCGCWLAALFSLLIALTLVGVGLFLPPVNLYDRLFGTPYAQLDAVNNAAASPDSSLKLVLDTADVGREFGVNLNSVTRDDFQNVNAQAGDWIPAAKASLPPYLVLQSQVYTIDTTGRAPGVVTFDVAVPPEVTNLDTLDVYGYDAETGRWSFLPARLNVAGSLTVVTKTLPDRLALFQAAPPDPTIVVPVDITQTLTADVAQVATIVSPAGMQPAINGSLVGSLAPGFNVNSAYRVMPVVRNFLDPLALDPDTVVAIIGNRSAREAHAQQLAAFAGSSGFDGVFIDYRDLPAEARENFSTFIRELKTVFRDSGLLVGVVVPAAQNEGGVWNTGAYDWQAIGEYADFVQINLPLDPTTYMPGEDRLVEAMLRWGVDEVSRYKLVAGVDVLSVREIGGSYAQIGYDAGLAGLGNVKIETEKNADGLVVPGAKITASLDGYGAIPGLDTQIQMPFVEYQNPDGSKAEVLWLMTGDTLRARLDRFDRFGIGGMAFTNLTDTGVSADVLASILDYKLQLPNRTQPGELALRWTVSDANGTIDEVTTRLNEDLVVTLAAIEGNFGINVEVIHGSSSSVRSGAAVAQFNPTSTPTPLPTATDTPVPTATPTLETIIPTQPGTTNNTGGQVITGGGGPAVPPGPGSIAGGFEYGGHVTGTSSEVATAAMRQAGMVWMKVQIGYVPGKNPGDVASIIGEARNRGFKVLLGIVGNPNDLAAGGAGYISGFADFLGGVASYGPDAIEVWNEPNINREWPEGTINGANYTSMLAQAYQRIKSANGNVLVISAALAPTGAEAAFPGKVVNDDNFLRQMVAAGAMNYSDCVGMHYNEGIVSPDQTSGDPRDNYYTRYLMPMIDVYSSITGGKPICITELGYLSPEGFGSLDAFFGWAANTTVAQHAAWLARAIALSSQTGKVRLLIVWNIDFTAYGSDPQAGYAIVRPGGGCPACETIAAAR